MSQRYWYRIVINLFLVATIGALAVTMYLTVARASVTVPGERERFTATATFDVSESAPVQAAFFSSQYDLSDRFPVATATSTSERAGGTVSIVNNYSRSQSLVRTTRLLTPDGKLFRISESVTVPAGGSVTVFAEADQPGDEFLVGPSKFTIPGLWEGIQDEIFAESSKPMTYERAASAQIKESDLNAAEAALTERILAKALNEFRTQLNDDSLAPEQLVSTRVTLSSNPSVGQEASEVEVSVRRTVSVVRVDRNAVLEQSRLKLIEQVPEPERFIEMIPDSLSFTVDAVDEAQKKASVTATASAWVRSENTAPQIDVQALTGITAEQARANLKSQGIIGGTIKTFPSWNPFMPLLADHITVEVK